MKISRGDIVLADYPYSDRSGSKVRPCLVVQDDHRNQRLHDTIIVMMSSRTRFVATDPTQLLIEASSPEGRQAGLLFDSAAQCGNLVTIDQSFIRRSIGTLNDVTMQKVDECLKAALGLS